MFFLISDIIIQMITIRNILLFVFLLSLIVSIHEFGHLVAAKIFGVYCSEYSIGFGPKLFSKKGKETEYNIRAIPLGGFVAMAGDTENSLETSVDTTNILFIGIGAFVGLDSIIKGRMNTNTMGFFSDNTRFEEPESYYKYVTPHDLKDYGFIPEFIGRFPIVCNVNKLSVDSLVAILKEPKNALIKQYSDLLQMDGVKLTFEDKALEMIAQEAYDLNTGARALRSILEKVLEDVMYEAPLKAMNGINEIKVTADMAEQRCKVRKSA